MNRLFAMMLMLISSSAWFNPSTVLSETEIQTATFAGGCFWSVESALEDIDGVVSAVSGYTGGMAPNPTYKEVSDGHTDHMEAVEVKYDPGKVNYSDLLSAFWGEINPTQTYDRHAKWSQYRTVIFTHNKEQAQLAQASIDQLNKSAKFKKPVSTEILPASQFYEAEEYHQDYYQKKKNRPTKDEIREKLTRIQYHVTQEDGTEPAFRNEYWKNKKAGIYVDIVSGEPLFSSTDKFKSGTGWPSFTRPLEPDNIVEKKDHKFGVIRVEVRSKSGDSHLGHVFNDGPRPTGLRYCINSAALRFIPKEELSPEGYGSYLKIFEKK